MNPMDLWNKSSMGANPQQQQMLMALQVLMGGLGNKPAASVLAPSLGKPPPQPNQKPPVGVSQGGRIRP